MNKDFKYIAKHEDDYRSWNKIQRRKNRHKDKQKIKNLDEDHYESEEFESREKFRKHN